MRFQIIENMYEIFLDFPGIFHCSFNVGYKSIFPKYYFDYNCKFLHRYAVLKHGNCHFSFLHCDLSPYTAWGCIPLMTTPSLICRISSYKDMQFSITEKQVFFPNGNAIFVMAGKCARVNTFTFFILMLIINFLN